MMTLRDHRSLITLIVAVLGFLFFTALAPVFAQAEVQHLDAGEATGYELDAVEVENGTVYFYNGKFAYLEAVGVTLKSLVQRYGQGFTDGNGKVVWMTKDLVIIYRHNAPTVFIDRDFYPRTVGSW